MLSIAANPAEVISVKKCKPKIETKRDDENYVCQRWEFKGEEQAHPSQRELKFEFVKLLAQLRKKIE